MPVIEISPSRVGAAKPGEFAFAVPRFGSRCVCCNEDARGLIQRYDPSTDEISAPSIDVPVCADCRGHALRTHMGPIMAGSGLCVGTAATALGFHYLAKRPDDSFLWGMIAFGIIVASLSLWWIVAATVREKRFRRGGHNAGLAVTIGRGPTIVTTPNETLAETLTELNPGARRRLTRAEKKKRLPEARALRRRDARAPTDR